MAEGRFQTSIQAGSDADIAYVCTPCSEDGTREEAFKYCPECEEYLCTTCSKYHLKMKATRGHELVDREEGKQRSKSTKQKEKLKCRQHPDRDIEMYCGSHDMVYCSMCIATNHRPCSGVTSLTDAVESNFQPNGTERLLKDTASMKTLLENTQKQKQENIVMIESKRKTIERRIQEVEENLMKHIKTLSKQANDALKETYASVEGKLESEITFIKKTRLEVEKVETELMSTLEANKEHQFVKVKICQQIIKDATTLHDKCKSDGQISIDFHEKTNETEQLLQVNTLGKIYETTSKSERRIKHQEEVNVRLSNDNKNCRIIDACKLDTGACILADTNNCKIKLLDTNLRVTDSFSVGGTPTGICRINHREVAVKLNTNKIELFSVDTRISQVRSISIKKGGDYLGFAYMNGNFCVGTWSNVEIYNTNGSFEKSITLRQGIGRKQMTTFKNLVFVADNNNGVVCLGSDDLKISVFRDSRLTSASGVCVSNDGTVFAIDKSSKKIIMFSEDGKCIGELVPEVPPNKDPQSLCFFDKTNSIIIGYLSSDTVTILHLSD